MHGTGTKKKSMIVNTQSSSVERMESRMQHNSSLSRRTCAMFNSRLKSGLKSQRFEQKENMSLAF